MLLRCRVVPQRVIKSSLTQARKLCTSAKERKKMQYAHWLATDPQARGMGNWERFMMQHWKGGKYFSLQTYPLESCPRWPAALDDVIATSGARLSLTQEFTKAPANLVVASQKRVLVQSRTQSWVQPFIEEFTDVPVYDLTIKQNYLHDLIKPIVKHIWTKSPISSRTIFLTTANRPDLSFTKLGIDVELSYTQYIFLVDSYARIRARGVSTATPAELESLFYATKMLISPAGIRQAHPNCQRTWAVGTHV